MRPATVSVLGALAALGLFAPATQAAATVATDVPCYLTNRTVRLHGSGFAESTPYTVSLDGTALGPGTTGADGSLTGRLGSGHLGHLHHQRHTITVSDGTSTASTQFEVTRFTAAFDPRPGIPARCACASRCGGLAWARSPRRRCTSTTSAPPGARARR